MKKNEKKLLLMAATIFTLLLVIRGIPAARDFYQAQQAELAALENRMSQYRDLLNNAGEWVNLELEKAEEVENLQQWIFTGNDPNLISSGLQRSFREVVEASSVSIREISVARFTNLDGWLMVSQEVSFNINQENILRFLENLENARPKLIVTEFSITRNRRDYSGRLTVVGFSRDAS